MLRLPRHAALGGQHHQCEGGEPEWAQRHPLRIAGVALTYLTARARRLISDCHDRGKHPAGFLTVAAAQFFRGGREPSERGVRTVVLDPAPIFVQ